VKQVRQTESVNAQVLDALRAAVITGELQPGTLHSVQTLATQLGVSRTPVLRDMVLRRGVSTVSRSRSLDDIVADHREVLDHIESRDVAGAAEAMRAHLLRTAELLIAHEAGAPPGSVDVDLGWTGR